MIDAIAEKLFDPRFMGMLLTSVAAAATAFAVAQPFFETDKLAKRMKIVSDELTALMGDANVALPLASKPPTIVLMAGLQGSGKTTCSAKLARHFHAQGRAPGLRPGSGIRRSLSASGGASTTTGRGARAPSPPPRR